MLGLAAAQQLRAALERAGVTLRTDLDLLAEVWPDRPGLPAAPVYEHRAPQAPLARAAKLAQVREAMARARRDAPLHLAPSTTSPGC